MRILLALFAAVLVGACGSYTLPVETPSIGGGNGGGGSVTVKDCNTLFASRMQPRLAFCRNCHVPGGVADVPDGHLYMLSQDASQDRANLHDSWERLGRNDNGKSRILKMASGTDDRSHTGGSPWPVGSDAYKEMDALLLGFVDPSACNLGVLGGLTEDLPLLGSSHGGHAWFDFCAGKSDDASLPPDPRSLVQPGIDDGKAVHFNAWWKDCHVNPELVGERAQPKTCGELRASHDAGKRLMLGNGGEGSGSIFQGDENIGFVDAADYNNVWRFWGMTSRPENFDQLVAERYGMPLAAARNPYPLPGEDPNQTDGGSGQLSPFMTQGHNADGTWNGKIGFTCHACHSGAAGLPEEGEGLGFQYGSGNSLHDIGVMAREFGLTTPGAAQVGLALALFASNRGTNNAQFANIVSPPGPGSTPAEIVGWPTSGSTASMDTPAWWNLGSRPLKFVDGVVPADAVRVDLSFYIPLFGSGGPTDTDAWTKAHDQDADHWLLAMKSPAYPLPVDTALAEQGAILFHSKNLWEASLNNPVPQPEGGNGSCASCHGAYAPRYVNDPGYLATPALGGIAGNIVPLAVIGTDPARLESFTRSGAAPGEYPETAGTQQDCGNQNSEALRGDRALGYLAPPLHGVWATAPYLHNGSVPDVASLLKPAERPSLWRRVSAPSLQANAVMGFDTSVQRAFDQDRLGWKFETLACGDGTLPVLDCSPVSDGPSPVQILLDEIYTNVLAGWNVGNLPVFAQWTPEQVENRKIYNTHQFSQGNAGHAFTSVLTDTERRALIEYLKTL